MAGSREPINVPGNGGISRGNRPISVFRIFDVFTSARFRISGLSLRDETLGLEKNYSLITYLYLILIVDFIHEN